MGLLSRFTTLLKADAHGVVDNLEDRSLLLRQHLREADREVRSKQDRRDDLLKERQALQDLLQGLAKERSKWDDHARLALAEEKDDLARFAIKKQLELDNRSAQVSDRLREIENEHGDLSETLSRQERELEELRARVKAHLDRVAKGRAGDPFTLPRVVEEQEVEIELLRRKREPGENSRKGASS